MKRYEWLARELAELIQAGVLRPGERLPSARALADSRRVSPATATQPLHLLEDQGFVQARPRSGFYVSAHWRAAAIPEATRPPATAGPLDVSELVFEVLASIRKRNVVPLGSAFPAPTLFPLSKLAQMLGRGARRMDPWRTVEGMAPGSADLRRQIAKRYAMHGVGVRPEEILITAGALEALNLCLQAVTRPGDVVAIESPAFYAALQTTERSGLRAVEIATHPVEGVDLESLDDDAGRAQARAGGVARHARCCARRGRRICELHHGHQAPPPCKTFDGAGLVMHCGSFSKSLAPGYRLGWCGPGRAYSRVERLKLSTSIATSIPVQDGIAEFLRHGNYDHHLRTLRGQCS